MFSRCLVYLQPHIGKARKEETVFLSLLAVYPFLSCGAPHCLASEGLICLSEEQIEQCTGTTEEGQRNSHVALCFG